MAGRHRLRGRRVQRTSRHRAIEVVDARTLTAHFLTDDALAAGRLPKGRYIALCGQEVLPASLTESGHSRCPSCVSIPSQRSTLDGRAANEDDRDLPMLLGSVGIRVGEIVTGLLEDNLSHDEQKVFGQQLVDLAEGFRQRALSMPIVIDRDAT